MENVVVATAEKEKSAKTLATVIYALYASSLLLGFTALIGVIMAHIKRGDVAGSVYESHLRYQIRTFWFYALWILIGIVTAFIVVGWVVLFAAFIWYVYRIIKGWLALNDGKAMYADNH